MMTTKVRYKVYTTAARKVIMQTTEETTRRAAEKTRDRVKQNIISAGRVSSGEMLRGVRATRLTAAGPRAKYAVKGTARHTLWQEEGIGPVHARPGGVLRFKPKGMSTYIFRSRTRGFKGAHFFRDAYRKLSAKDFLA